MFRVYFTPSIYAFDKPLVPDESSIHSWHMQAASVHVHLCCLATGKTQEVTAVLAWGSQSAQDAKKAKVWGTLAKKIVQAAKAGGSDPSGNAKLADVLKACKAAEVPKDIIERNLKKATDKSQADYQEVRPWRPASCAP